MYISVWWVFFFPLSSAESMNNAGPKLWVAVRVAEAGLVCGTGRSPPEGRLPPRRLPCARDLAPGQPRAPSPRGCAGEPAAPGRVEPGGEAALGGRGLTPAAARVPPRRRAPASAPRAGFPPPAVAVETGGCSRGGGWLWGLTGKRRPRGLRGRARGRGPALRGGSLGGRASGPTILALGGAGDLARQSSPRAWGLALRGTPCGGGLAPWRGRPWGCGPRRRGSDGGWRAGWGQGCRAGVLGWR